MMKVRSDSIINQLNQKKYQCLFSEVNASFLKQLQSLQDEVCASLEDPTIFFPLSEKEFDTVLHGQGMIVGAFVKNKLISFRVAYFPGIDSGNLGNDLDLTEKELAHVVHFEASVVHPAWRNNDLQKKMGSFLFDRIKKMHNYKHICTTVALDNYASLKDKFYHHMVIKKIAYKYNQYIRFILYQNVSNPLVIDEKSTIKVLITDVEKQRKLLQSGYLGYKLVQTKTKIYLYYGQEI